MALGQADMFAEDPLGTNRLNLDHKFGNLRTELFVTYCDVFFITYP